jgi:hypothetical protein
LTVGEDRTIALPIGVALPGFGKVVISGFAPQHDTIQFDKSVFADFAAVTGHARQVGADTVITDDQNDTITLKGISLSKLQASNFIFVSGPSPLSKVAVTITGLPADASLNDSAGPLTVINGSITLTAAQLAGLTLRAGGLTSAMLSATATNTEDAVANSAPQMIALTVNPAAPILSAPAAASVAEDGTVLLGISETPANPSDVVSIAITGVPADAILSAGSKNPDGSWTLTAAQLAGLKLDAGEVTTRSLTVTATDTGSGAAASASIALSVTPVAPTLSAPAALSVAQDGAVTLGIVETPFDPRDVVSITITGVPADASLSAGSKNPDGSWTLTPPQLAGLQLDAGGVTTANLTVTATNILGAGASASISIALSVTSTAPSLSAALSVAEDGTVLLGISETPANPSDVVSIAITGVPADASLSAGSKNPDGSWTLTAAQLAGLKLDAGEVTTTSLTVTATDTGSGAAASASIALSVTPVAPTLSALAALSVAQNGTVTLGIVETPFDPRDVVSTTITGVPADASLSAGSKNPDGSWTLTPPQLAGLQLDAGDTAGSLYIVASNTTAGHVASAATDIVVTINSSAAGSSLTAALSDDTGISATDGITSDPAIAGGLTDAAAITAFTASLDGNSEVSELGQLQPNGSFALSTAQMQALDGGALADGKHSLVLTATDTNNQTASQTVSFTLEKAPPALTAALAHVTGGASGVTSDPTIDGTVTDPVGIASFTATFDNNAPSTAFDISATVQPGGSFELTPALLARIDGGSLPDGAHTLHLDTVDTAGNSTKLDVDFSLETTPPPAPIFNLAASDQVGTPVNPEAQSGRVTLVGQTGPGDTVTLTATGETTLANTTGAFQLTNVALVQGPNPLTVTATDFAGNTSSFSLTVQGLAPTSAPDPVLQWNQTTLQAIATDADAPTVASRALAMESLAVYDAISAIDGTPGYLIKVTARADASADAAVAAAADTMLDNLYPAQAANFDAQLAADLAAIPAGQGKSDGVALGVEVAKDIIALRANDGSSNTVIDNGSTAVGQWRPTAPGFANAVTPQWADVTPFALESPDQFLPPPPPALDSAAYAAAVNETESLGAGDSTSRTAAETQAALFWNDQTGTFTPAGEWNSIADQIAQAQGDSMATDAQLLAELNIAEADSGIASWNTKYTYNAWRPITAIQNANEIGNPGLTQDPTWTPLLTTPAFPEYVAGHAVYSEAAAQVLDSFFGSNYAFSTTSPSLAGVTLSFSSFDAAAQNAGDSRIWGGIHFPFSVDAGFTVGQEVGDWTLAVFNPTQDTVPPKLVLNQASGLVTNTDPTITGDVTDNLSGVASLAVSLDGGTATVVSFDANGNFSVPVSLPTDGTADGQHTLTFSAVDAAGNVTSPVVFSFTLDTQAPQISLAADSIQNSGTLAAGAVLDGAVTTEAGVALTALSYAFDGGASAPLGFDATSGAFDQALNLSQLGAGNHTLTLTATDAAGNSVTDTLNVALPSLPLLTIAELTPMMGASDVGVTYRPQITFSRAVDPATLTSSSLYATDTTGATVQATVVPTTDNAGNVDGAWLLFTNQLPGASTITLHVDGDQIKGTDGSLLDAAGTGTPGTDLTETFTTVSTAAVPNTTISGIVADPGPDDTPMTPDDYKAAADGSLDFANDTWKLLIAGVKVYVLGDEQDAVYTNTQGQFTLTNVPTGDVKVVFEGTTATNDPAGIYFPTMTMDLTNVRPGIANTVMGSMGTLAEQQADAADPAIYLPRIDINILTPVSTTAPTVVTDFGSGQVSLTAQQLSELSLTVMPGSLVDANGNPVSGAEVGVSPVPPAIVQDMLPAGILQHSFDITIQAPGGAVFTQPATLTVPNTLGLAPGEQTFVLSFDHTTGRLVIDGTATVSADGQTITTDPGSGVTQPGWHGFTPVGSEGMGDISVPCGVAGVGLGALGALQSSQLAMTKGSLGIETGIFNALEGLYKSTGLLQPQISQAILNGNNTVTSVAQALAKIAPYLEFAGKIFASASGVSDVISLVNDIRTGQGLGKIEYDIFKVGLDAATFAEGGPLAKLAVSLIGYGVSAVDIARNEDFEGAENEVKESEENFGKAKQALTSTGEWAPQEPEDAAITVAAADCQADLQNLQSELNNLSTAGDDIQSDLPNIESFLQNYDSSQPMGGYSQDTFDSSISTMSQLITDENTIVNQGDPSVTAEQLVQDVSTPNDDINSEIFMPYTTMHPLTAASMTTTVGKTLYAALQSTDGTVQRFTFDTATGISYFLAPGTTYTLTVFDPASLSIGQVVFQSAASGVNTQIPNVPLVPQADFPADGGLDPLAAFVLGVDPTKASNLVAGVTDVTALQEGLVGNSSLLNTTGVIASLPLQGSAQAVVLVGSTTNTAQQTAYVATNGYGLAIVDAGDYQAPTVLGQIKLSGNATDVAVDNVLDIAAVATGTGGLDLVDVTTPAAPALIRTVAANATAVQAFEGIAYANDGNKLDAIDLATGEILQTLSLGTAAITGLARDGTMLYSMDASDTLRTIDISSGLMVADGSLTLSAGGGRLFVANGLAYVPTNDVFSGGYSTVDVSNPSAPKLISGPSNAGIESGAIALNGSGLGVLVGQDGGGSSGVVGVDVVNTSDPTKTGQFETRYTLPAQSSPSASEPLDTAIGSGIAFVAAGTDGLRVVNYEPFDTTGIPPTIQITQLPMSVNPSASEIQVDEGENVTIGATVSDNVQVRNVELLVNGQVALNDVSYPFDLSTVMPTIASNGSDQVTLQVEAIDTEATRPCRTRSRSSSSPT